MTAIPKIAAKQLNTNATIPLASNPLGSGSGLLAAPLRSNRSLELPAALPATGMFWALHASRWSSGILSDFCRSSGASIIVATSPDATCHSTWQWKSHTPGLSARKRRTMLPFGFTMNVSRRIGTAGKVSLPT